MRNCYLHFASIFYILLTGVVEHPSFATWLSLLCVGRVQAHLIYARQDRASAPIGGIELIRIPIGGIERDISNWYVCIQKASRRELIRMFATRSNLCVRIVVVKDQLLLAPLSSLYSSIVVSAS